MAYKEKRGKTVENHVNRLSAYLKIIKYYMVIICTHIESINVSILLFELFLSRYSDTIRIRNVCYYIVT